MHDVSNRDTHLHTPRNGLISLSDDNIRNAAIWADHRWNVEWLDNTTRLRTFNHDIGTHPIWILPITACIRLNRLCTDLGRFLSCLTPAPTFSSAKQWLEELAHQIKKPPNVCVES